MGNLIGEEVVEDGDDFSGEGLQSILRILHPLPLRNRGDQADWGAVGSLPRQGVS